MTHFQNRLWPGVERRALMPSSTPCVFVTHGVLAPDPGLSLQEESLRTPGPLGTQVSTQDRLRKGRSLGAPEQGPPGGSCNPGTVLHTCLRCQVGMGWHLRSTYWAPQSERATPPKMELEQSPRMSLR